VTAHATTPLAERRDLFLLLDDIQEFLLEMPETPPTVFAVTIEDWLNSNVASGSGVASESLSLDAILEDAVLRLYNYYSPGVNTPNSWRDVTEFCRACLNSDRVQFARSIDANTNHQRNAAWSNALSTDATVNRQLWVDAPESDIDSDPE
jgi:hypothetical protein